MLLHDAIAKELKARGFLRTRDKYLAALRLAMFLRDARPRTKRERGLVLRMLGLTPWHTLVTAQGLLDVSRRIDAVEKERVPGAIVECGVWRGGCSALMASVLRDHGSRRDQWLFDSFAGLPAATEKDGPEAADLASGRFDGALEPVGDLGVDVAAVRSLVDRYRGDASKIHIIQGWFQDTLHANADAVGNIAVLRLDGDWYESTRVALEALYDNVVPGGHVILDDYGALPGCRRAVADFFAARGEPLPAIEMADAWVGSFTRPKEGPAQMPPTTPI